MPEKSLSLSTIPVSVVIPCYQCSDTIERAVASVAAQSILPNEIVLVDDCSQDATLEVIYQLIKQYPSGWIKVVPLKANVGAGSARNAGWAIANQPYIAFLDADDVWYPEKLSLQYTIMHNHPEVAMSAHACVWPNAISIRVDVSKMPKIKKIKPVEMLSKNRFSTPTVMLRNEIPLRFGDGKRYGEDYDLWLQIAFSGLIVFYIDAPLAELHKMPYGEAGLSAKLWAMEQGELEAYLNLHHKKKISLTALGFWCVWSLIKFARRIFIVTLKRTFCR